MIKIAPVSGDMLVKVGAVVLALGGIAYAVYWAKNKAMAAAVTTFNPASPNNVVYSTMNQTFGAGDSNWTLGGWIYDATHPAYNPNARPATEEPSTYPIPITIM